MTDGLKDAKASTEINGIVFDIQAFSIHDGPGIRTTVFLKGCPLRCLWCHNPESWAREAQISWTPSLCAGCGACVTVCPVGAHSKRNGVHVYDRERCTVCGKCVEVCPARALEQSGRSMTVSEAMAKVLADKQFFMDSGGGLTVSGGEPLMQADFAVALLAAGRAGGIHTAVETSGAGRPQDLERVVGQSDLVLFDIKAASGDYRRLTGADYDHTVASLQLIQQAGCELWLRLPLIPGVNDTPLHFENIAQLAKQFHPKCVEMIPYHTLGLDKRNRFGMPEVGMPTIPSADQNQIDQWRTQFRERGVNARLPGED